MVSLYGGNLGMGEFRTLGVFDTWLCLLRQLPEWHGQEEVQPAPSPVVRSIPWARVCVTCDQPGDAVGWAGWYRITEIHRDARSGFRTVAACCSIACMDEFIADLPGVHGGLAAAFLAQHPDKVVDRAELRAIFDVFPEDMRSGSNGGSHRTHVSKKLGMALITWERKRWVERLDNGNAVKILHRPALLSVARYWFRAQRARNAPRHQQSTET